MATTELLEIYPWNEDGYMPLVFTDDWMVAILNWEDIFAWENVGEIERHNETDEVFVLTKGRAVLFVVSPEGEIQVEDMRPSVVYNVPQGVWHNLIATHDASWIIVENRDTHLHDCEFRQLEETEKARLETELPDWVQKTS